MSYSTNDLSNITHKDVNFTKDLSESSTNSANINGTINKDSEKQEHTNNTELANDINTKELSTSNASEDIVQNDSTHQLTSTNLHANSNGKEHLNYLLIFYYIECSRGMLYFFIKLCFRVGFF